VVRVTQRPPTFRSAGAGGVVTRFCHRRWEESRSLKPGDAPFAFDPFDSTDHDAVVATV